MANRQLFCWHLQQAVHQSNRVVCKHFSWYQVEVLPLPSQLLCYWLHHWLFGGCATHCRAIATIVQYLPQVSAADCRCLVWIKAPDSRAMLEQFRSLENLTILQTCSLLLSNFFLSLHITSLAIVLACYCSWFWPSCLANSPQYDESLYWHFLPSIVGELRRFFSSVKTLCWLDQVLLSDVIAVVSFMGHVDFRCYFHGGQRCFGRLIRIYPNIDRSWV